MSTTLIVILLSVAAVGIFVLGLSLTLIFKGHYMKSEISENDNMRKLGIKCAVQQMREEESGKDGSLCDIAGDCSPAGCASCGAPPADKNKSD